VKEQKPRPRDSIRQATRKPKARSTDRHRNGKSEEQERLVRGLVATGRASGSPRPAARTGTATARAKSDLPGKRNVRSLRRPLRRAVERRRTSLLPDFAPKSRKRRHGALKRPSVAVWVGYSATFSALLEGKANGKPRRRFLDTLPQTRRLPPWTRAGRLFWVALGDFVLQPCRNPRCVLAPPLGFL